MTLTSAYNAPPLSKVANCVKSVNYFISHECNYKCKFCFHAKKIQNTNKLELGKAKLGLQLLQHSSTEKINFAGGKPFLNPKLLVELCKYAHKECSMAVSIISNGSLIKPDCELQYQIWTVPDLNFDIFLNTVGMNCYGKYVDILGVSVDSFDPTTNAAIGRGGDNDKK